MNFGLVPSLKRAKTGYQILQAFVTLISLKLKFKVHSDLLGYFIHTKLNVIGSIFLFKKTKKNILKKINSMKGLVSLRFLTSKDPIIRI